ncbi:DinB family protein [Pseudomonas hefeiensis]|uniref:DinB family protein n=1 Tax=Pseudomonas hefeiensis TaxID=2738125 RepID=A0ABY9GIK2_9PSED|nr:MULTISPECIES: DinB family protein [unclassified Pseudomonas]WLH15377.1 DinB family protein [Pseudomonas sp. FP205]WLH98428.1 DinB family protein [Pseudomonas sp. FP53]WLI42690.1 DinB family protein [Pseudomonas sp. FP821]
MSVQVSVESLSKCSWNGCPNARGIRTQDLRQLEEAFTKANQWFVDYTKSVTATELSEPVAFIFKDGKPGNMTKEQILAHVLSHGLQHRGGVGTILPREILEGHQDHFTTFLKL